MRHLKTNRGKVPLVVEMLRAMAVGKRTKTPLRRTSERTNKQATGLPMTLRPHRMAAINTLDPIPFPMRTAIW
jgi:hypothetical protein